MCRRLCRRAPATACLHHALRHRQYRRARGPNGWALYAGSFCPGSPAGERLRVAGPSSKVPSLLNREPCRGQSQDFSLSFQCTIPPRWVQTADKEQVFPFTVDVATGLRPRTATTPVPSAGTAALSWGSFFSAACDQSFASVAATPALREKADAAPGGDVTLRWIVLAHSRWPPRMSAAIPRAAATAFVIPHLL